MRILMLGNSLGQFTRNYTQTVKRAADNKRRYAPVSEPLPVKRTAKKYKVFPAGSL